MQNRSIQAELYSLSYKITNWYEINDIICCQGIFQELEILKQSGKYILKQRGSKSVTPALNGRVV